MTAMYGHKFTSTYGESAHETWVTVLIGITGRQIADGLNACLENYPEWPPGAAQFRALCLGLNPRNVDEQGNDSTWQHSWIERQNQEYQAMRKSKQLRLLDADAVERNKKLGNQTAKNILSSFA